MSADTRSPAEILRAAAARLEQAAAKAEPGPWYTEPDDLDRGHEVWSRKTGHMPARGHCESDAAWIAMMSPVIAEPLSAWLEQAADELTEVYWGNAYLVALAILGIEPAAAGREPTRPPVVAAYVDGDLFLRCSGCAELVTSIDVHKTLDELTASARGHVCGVDE